jgi:tetratricopeptide (TPR) repeat protein
MTSPSAICPEKSLLVLIVAIFLVAGVCACRRSGNKDGNANGKVSSNTVIPGSDEAKVQAQSLIKQGKQFYDNDQVDQASEVLKQAVTLDPESAEGHLRLGMAYAALDNKDEADEEYKKAIERYKKKLGADSKEADDFFNLAEAYSFRHQDEEAVRAYRQATKLKSDDEEAFYRLGMAETRLAHYPEAMSAFEEALELDPDDSRATEGLENAREGNQRIKEGKKHAEDMLKKQQENANANANFGINTNPTGKPTPKRNSGRPW